MTNINNDPTTIATTDIARGIIRDMQLRSKWTPSEDQIRARIDAYCDNPDSGVNKNAVFASLAFICETPTA